jgi:hypothetical protein
MDEESTGRIAIPPGITSMEEESTGRIAIPPGITSMDEESTGRSICATKRYNAKSKNSKCSCTVILNFTNY